MPGQSGTGLVVRPMGAFAQAMGRLYQRPNETIRGIDQSGWFSPLQPVPSFAPEGTEPRAFQYSPGQNLIWTPRYDAEYSTDQLRDLSRYPLARFCIENTKDMLIRTDWEIQLKPEHGETAKQTAERGKGDSTLLKLNKFFEAPNPDESWPDFWRLILDDMLTCDAPAIMMRKKVKGELVELRWIDGSTITRYIDENGFTPQPPDPAYEQVWWGMPFAKLTTDQLVYRPRNISPRKDSIASYLYGYSPTEQAALEIQVGIKRLEFVLAYYTEGSVPGVVHVIPRGTPVERIVEAMQWMNSDLAGNLSGRRQWRMVQGFNEPGKPDQIEFTKEPLLSDTFDDLHIRKICFAYGQSPQRLMRMMNRATAEQSDKAAESEGVLPYLTWMKSTVDYIIQRKMGLTDYEIKFTPSKETDPEKEANRLKTLVGGGLMTENEGRDVLGLDESPQPEANMLGIVTGTGFVPLGMAAATAGVQTDPKSGATTVVAVPGDEGDAAGGPGKPPGKKPAAPAGADEPGKPPGKKPAATPPRRGKSTIDVQNQHCADHASYASSCAACGHTTLAYLEGQMGEVLTKAEDYSIESPMENADQTPGAWYGRFHKLVNEELRAGRAIDDVDGREVVDALDALFASGDCEVFDHEGYVWAGFDSQPVFDQFIRGGEDFWLNRVIGDHAFVMTSIDEQIAENRSHADHSVRLNILLPEGTRYVVGRPEEKERILDRDLRFKVITYQMLPGLIKMSLALVSSTEKPTWITLSAPFDDTSVQKVAKRAPKKRLEIDPTVVTPRAAKARKRIERAVRDKLRELKEKAVAELKKSIDVRFTKAEGDDVPEETVGEVVERLLRVLRPGFNDLPKALREAYEEAALAGVDLGVAQLELEDTDLITAINKVARDWADDRAAELVGMRWTEDGGLVENPDARYAIDETTRDDVREIVSRAFERESAPNMSDISNAIEDAGTFSESRAEMIAKTEVARAQSQGNLVTWRESGMVKTVDVVLGGNHDLDDECDDAADGSPYPIDETPDIPLHPNCECMIITNEIEDNVETAKRSRTLRKYSDDQARDDSGRWTSGDGGSSRSERALASYKPMTKEIMAVALKNQQRLADAIKGTVINNNKPFDVEKGKHAFEVKTIIHAKNDKITMHPESRDRKEQEAKARGLKPTTIVFDERGRTTQVLVRTGVGAFRLSNMEKVTLTELAKRYGK